MNARAEELIRVLNLHPHPEGGYFAEVFRSSASVAPADPRGERAALTAIYFLLVETAISRWHRVLSDEAWHWYEGSPLELFTARTTGGCISRTVLGPLSDSSAPMHVVAARSWQAARPLGAYALVGCSVAPGFDYSDFILLSSMPEAERPVLTPTTIAEQLL